MRWAAHGAWPRHGPHRKAASPRPNRAAGPGVGLFLPPGPGGARQRAGRQTTCTLWHLRK
eukprot:6281282-Prymnesium_polylepis.1